MSTTYRLSLICVLVLTAGVAQGRDSTSMTSEIIDTIEDFESEKDAKCYATATRLENFIYGTPLSDDARFLKIDLQKQIILQVWETASAAVAARGGDQIEAADVAPLLQQIRPHRTDAEKNILVDLPDRTLVLAERDFRHYSSIAYALRAILGVQQDQMWMSGEPLTPLAPGAVSALREALDVMTLAALALADEGARAESEATISPDRFTDGWAGVVTATSSASTRTARTGDTAARPAFSTFRAIVDQKIQSYEGYNAIERDRRAALFLENVRRFYARFYAPPGGLGLPESMGRAAETFVSQLIERAQASSKARGEPLIRAKDMNDALQAVTPHAVDDLEDVTFFPNLEPDDRVVLAAFDLDSFRDFGMHWRLLRVMLDMGRVELSSSGMEPDPFAAELIAEGLAQYSVLLLRIAGDLAAREQKTPFVSGAHLERSGSEIERLAKLHHETPAKTRQAAPIRSSAKTATPASGAFMTDVTTDVGIDFEHRSSDWLNRFRRAIPVVPPTFSGGGVAAGDVDGDGRDDLLFVGGIGNTLYLNDGKGAFVPGPQTASLTFEGRDGLPGEARQPILADFDNDGDQDVLITYVDAPHRLLENQGAGRLLDATARAGLGGEDGVAGPATVFDFDRDGLLDVYVCYFGNYLKGYDAAKGKTSGDEFEGALPSLARNNDNGGANRLFRNRGGLRFEEVDGTGAADHRWCQAVTHSDFDGDGFQDLIVANDFGRNSLLRNLGGEGQVGRFADVSEGLGMTHTYHSMNVGLADLNADLHPDIYVSNINMMAKDNRYVLPDENTRLKLGAKEMAGVHIVETSMLYMSSGTDAGLQGYESSDAVERGNHVGWAWDAEFFDFDNDGDDDLYVLNGANEYFNYLARREVGGSLAFNWNMEPNVFYMNEGGALENVSERSGADFAGNSRAAVYLDHDGDGDLDMALNNFHGPATFFRNDLNRPDAHFVKLRLEGAPEKGSNRDAIGARILLRTGDGKQIWREVHGGSGYLSMEPKEQHTGLGASDTVDVSIRWPGGGEQELRGLAADTTWVIRENQPPRAVGD